MRTGDKTAVRVFALYLPSMALAVAVAAEPVQLSLSDCLSKISANSVQIAQATLNTAKAQGALDESMRPRLPQLVAQGNLATYSDEVSAPNDGNKAVIRIEQGTLPFGSAWKLGHQRSAEIEVAQLGQVESAQDVELLVKQLYFSILRDQDAVRNSNLVETQLKHLLDSVVPRFQIGRAPQFDLVKVKSALYDLARSREVLRSQLLGEKSQLSEIIGLKDLGFELRPLVQTPALPAYPERAASESEFSLVRQNPTLRALSKAVDASRATEGVTRAARIPTLSAAVEYGLTGPTPSTMVTSWNAFAQLRLTIFDWGLISSQERQAGAATALAEKKLEAERQRVASDVIQTRALAEAHLADQKRLQSLLPELKRATNASLDRYRKAAVGIIEATDSVSLWLQNLQNERAAYYGYLTDLAHLERVTGHVLEVDYGI